MTTIGVLSDELRPDGLLWFYVIYQRPQDYPNHFVLRKQAPGPGGVIICDKECWVADTLELIRQKVPPGLIRIPRDPADVPAIVESWF